MPNNWRAARASHNGGATRELPAALQTGRSRGAQDPNRQVNRRLAHDLAENLGARAPYHGALHPILERFGD